MYEIGVRGRFSAAHRIEGYDGSCAALHGHNWEVEVYVRGDRPDGSGMLLDFRRLKSDLNGVLELLDHHNLNDVPALEGRNPTSETIARFVFERVAGMLRGESCGVDRVTVRETADTAATYRQND